MGFEGDMHGSVLKLNARSNYFRAVSTSESTVPARPQSLKRRAAAATRPRNADPNATTRLDILKSAAKAFRRLGYHGATVEQIAAALHMKKGNLYYYFKNKEEILFACHQYSLDQLISCSTTSSRATLPPDEKLRRLIVAFVHTILDELHGTALFLELEALVARAPEGRHRPPRHVRSRRAADPGGRDGGPARSRPATRSCCRSRCSAR